MLASEPVSRLSRQIDPVTASQQRFAEMRAEESGAAGDD